MWLSDMFLESSNDRQKLSVKARLLRQQGYQLTKRYNPTLKRMRTWVELATPITAEKTQTKSEVTTSGFEDALSKFWSELLRLRAENKQLWDELTLVTQERDELKQENHTLRGYNLSPTAKKIINEFS
jgi:hypothetical protein